MSWKIRGPDVKLPARSRVPDYGENTEYFTIRFHHSGKFVTKPTLTYMGGNITHVDYCTKDEISYLEVCSMVAAIGIEGSSKYYYSCTNPDDVQFLSPIVCDAHALELGLFNENSPCRIVGLFVDHDDLPMRDILHPEIPEDGWNEDGEGSVGLSDIGEDGWSDIVDLNNSGDSDEVSQGEDSENSDYFGESDGNYDIDNREFERYVDSEEEWGGLMKCKGKKPVTVPEKTWEVPGVVTKGKTWEPITLGLSQCFLDAEEFRKTVRGHAIQLGRELIFPINNKYKVQARCKNEGCKWLVYASRQRKDDTFMIKTIYEKHTCPRLNKVVHADSRFLFDKYKKDIQLNPTWPVKAMFEQLKDENAVEFSRAQLYRTKRKVTSLGDGVAEQYSSLWSYAEEIFHTNPGSTVRIKCKNLGDDVVFKRMYICWDALKKGMLGGCRRLICLDGCHLKTIQGGVILTAVGIDSNNGIYPFAYAVVEKEKKKSWLWFLDLVVNDLNIENSALWTVMSDKQKGLVDAVSEKLPHSEHRFCVVHLHSNFKLAHKGLGLKNLFWKAARASRVTDFNLAMTQLRLRNAEAFEWLQKRDPKHWSRSHFSVLNKTDLLYNNLSESFNAMILSARSKPILQMLEEIRLVLMLRIATQRSEMSKHNGNLCPTIESILDVNKERAQKFKALWNGENEFNVQYSSTVAFKVHLGDRTCSCRRWDLTGIPCPHAICCMYFMGQNPEDYVDECYKKETYLRVYGHFLHPLNSKDEWTSPTGERCTILPPRVSKMPGRPKKHARKLQPGETRPSQTSQRSTPTPAHQPQRIGRMGRKGVILTCKSCGIQGHNTRTCGKKRGSGLEIPAPNPENEKGKRKRKTQEEFPQEAANHENQIRAGSSKPPKTQKLQVRRRGKKMESGEGTSDLGSVTPTKTMSQPNPSASPSGSKHRPKLAMSQPNPRGPRGVVHVTGEEESPECKQQ